MDEALTLHRGWPPVSVTYSNFHFTSFMPFSYFSDYVFVEQLGLLGMRFHIFSRRKQYTGSIICIWNHLRSDFPVKQHVKN